ncbi:MAG: CcmD family protein [Chitinophagaceae bacterium]
MMNKKMILLLCIMLSAITTFAQSQNVSTDVMRSNGKIYVVMAVCLTILIGLIAYVVATDKKISKLEKEINGY